MHESEATFIHEDVLEATQQAVTATNPDTRRVQIWLTDGTSNYENKATQKMYGKHAPAHLHSRQETLNELTGSQVVVSALLERSVLTNVTRPLMFMNGRTGDIENYAELTGGPVLRTSKPEVADRFAALLDLLRQRYRLGYRPTFSSTASKVHHIHLDLSPAFFTQHRELPAKDVVIRTRQTYSR